MQACASYFPNLTPIISSAAFHGKSLHPFCMHVLNKDTEAWVTQPVSGSHGVRTQADL